jgi:hypothetical protein
MSKHINTHKSTIDCNEYVDVKRVLDVELVLCGNVVHEVDLLGFLDDLFQSELAL